MRKQNCELSVKIATKQRIFNGVHTLAMDIKSGVIGALTSNVT